MGRCTCGGENPRRVTLTDWFKKKLELKQEPRPTPASLPVFNWSRLGTSTGSGGGHTRGSPLQTRTSHHRPFPPPSLAAQARIHPPTPVIGAVTYDHSPTAPIMRRPIDIPTNRAAGMAVKPLPKYTRPGSTNNKHQLTNWHLCHSTRVTGTWHRALQHVLHVPGTNGCPALRLPTRRASRTNTQANGTAYHTGLPAKRPSTTIMRAMQNSPLRNVPNAQTYALNRAACP